MSALLGLRLAVAGGRDALARLVLTAFGVGLGVILLLLSLAGQSALQGREDRSAWQDTESSTRATAPDPALWLAVSDHYAGEALHRVHVAPLGPRPPVPPGLDRLPAPGEVAVSPALRRLLTVTPDDQLDDRFPGRVTTTIGAAGLRHPDHLVAVVGHTPAELRRLGGAQEVRGIQTQSLDLFEFTRLALALAAILMLFPVMVFVIMVTRITAARREQRLAAIRLAGATRSQTVVMAATETALGAAAGPVVGWLGYLVVRPILVAHLRYGGYQGGRFFSADFAVPLDQTIGVLVGVPALAMAVTIVSLRRVRVTPLGISGHVPHRPPGVWRALPVAVGIIGLVIAAISLRDRPDRFVSSGLQWVIPGLLLCTLVGAVVIGPLACLLLSRAMARCSRRTPTLMAARRIAADPRATYRAVGGVALAVFVATLLTGLIGGTAPDAQDDGRLRPGVVEIYAGGQPEARLAPLMSDRMVVVRGGPVGDASVACAELARVVSVSCPHRPGALFLPTASQAMWATFGGLVEPGPSDRLLP
ncbi:MAG: FtsX-like permease family protein, partial [Actinomadura sp.]